MVQVLPNIVSGIVDVGLGKQNTTIYCVLSGGEALIVDAGFYAPETERFFRQMLEQYKIDPHRTKLFITHDHVDHIGLAPWCAELGMEIFQAPRKQEEYPPEVSRRHLLRLFGVPDSLDCSRLFMEAPISPSMDAVPYTTVYEGDVLTVGEHRFLTVALPGHSDDQLGLYEESSGVVFCGDHILSDIVPMIPTTHLNKNHLITYFESIWKVQSLRPSLLLPGHGAPIPRMDGTLDRVIGRITLEHEHFTARVKETLSEQAGSASVFDIGRRLYRIPEEAFFGDNGYPHFLMLARIMTSLEFLMVSGRTARTIQNGVPYYSSSI